MDDPKETKQGTPQQDDAGLSSGGVAGTSQDTTPETLTREAAQKLVSDALAKQGRELKAARAEAEQYKSSYSKLESDFSLTKQQLEDLQRREDERAEEEARGDPESFRRYREDKHRQQEKDELKAERQRLERERTEHASELSAAKEAKAEMAIISAAVEHHVDIGKLKEKCQRFNLTTEEQISDMAETLAGQAEPGGDGKKKIPRGDSGATIGGGTDEDSLKRRYPTMFAK